MLRPVAADDSEQLTPTLSILQIALVQAETDGFASKMVYLISQSAFWTAKNFHDINWWSYDLGVCFYGMKFLFHHGHQALEVPTFLITLAFYKLIYLPGHERPVAVIFTESHAVQGSSHSDARGSTGRSSSIVDGTGSAGTLGVRWTRI